MFTTTNLFLFAEVQVDLDNEDVDYDVYGDSLNHTLDDDYD